MNAIIATTNQQNALKLASVVARVLLVVVVIVLP
jgi:hypothetical protein